MELRGDDPFRLRSYRNAAEAIEVWPTPLQEIAEKEGVAGLQTIPGVGKAIAGKIIELLDRGTFDAWERVIAETPETSRSPGAARHWAQDTPCFIKSSKYRRLMS